MQREFRETKAVVNERRLRTRIDDDIVFSFIVRLRLEETIYENALII